MQGIICYLFYLFSGKSFPARRTTKICKTIGFPISYYLALNTYWEINGIWIGLLTGLSVSALFLIARFHYITKKLITQ